eukprot:753882-Hanusia_phi.AAC.5
MTGMGVREACSRHKFWRTARVCRSRGRWVSCASFSKQVRDLAGREAALTHLPTLQYLLGNL